MMEERKLIEFCYYNLKGKNESGEPIREEERYIVYGTYQMEKTIDCDGLPFYYPDFEDLRAVKVVDRKEIPYTPTGETFRGHRFDVSDMINSALSVTITDDMRGIYETIWLEEGLRAFVDPFHAEDRVALEIKGVKIYKYIWVSTRCAPFKLDLVTDSYIFYTNGEELLQYGTADHSLEADGEFAEMGYWELVKEIRSGTETLLWGEIPEEDIDE